jgi:hypothetical protein
VPASPDPALEVRAYAVGAIDSSTTPFHVADLQVRLELALELSAFRGGQPFLGGESAATHLVRARQEAAGKALVVTLVRVAELPGREGGYLAVCEAVRRLRPRVRGAGLHLLPTGELLAISDAKDEAALDQALAADGGRPGLVARMVRSAVGDRDAERFLNDLRARLCA